jgi:hypothetical protein
MTVFDAAGQALFTLSAAAGQPLMTTTRYLAEGTYTVRYTSQSAAEIQYQLFLYQISEGAGPYATSTGTTAGSSPGGTTGTSGSGYTYTGSSTTRPSGSPYYF